MSKDNILIFLLCIIFICVFYFGFIYERKPDWIGMPIKNEPKQKNIKNAMFFNYEEFLITPLADYEITGIVLSTKRYFFDATSSISPIDIAIAWNKMSVADVIKDMKFEHGRRHLIYGPKNKEYWPIMENEVKNCLSNNHCIPANKEIKKKLLRIKQYDIVTLKGQLVMVEKVGMEPWVSSLSRDDNGEWGKLGGCEIIYVTNVEARKS